MALYDFESVVDGDLTFRAGEVLTVVENLGEWLRGYCGSRKGIFPSNFVSPFEPKNKVNTVSCLSFNRKIIGNY